MLLSHCISLVIIRLLLHCGQRLLDGYNNGLASLVNDSVLLFSFVFGIDVFALLIMLLIVVTSFCVHIFSVDIRSMPYGKERGGLSKTQGGSSSTSDPLLESEQGEVASPLSPISDDSGFSKASTSSNAEIHLEKLVSDTMLRVMKSALLVTRLERKSRRGWRHIENKLA